MNSNTHFFSVQDTPTTVKNFSSGCRVNYSIFNSKWMDSLGRISGLEAVRANLNELLVLTGGALDRDGCKCSRSRLRIQIGENNEREERNGPTPEERAGHGAAHQSRQHDAAREIGENALEADAGDLRQRFAFGQADDCGNKSRIEREIDASRKNYEGHRRMGDIRPEKKIGRFTRGDGAQHESSGAEGDLDEARMLGGPQRLHESGYERNHHDLRKRAGQHGEKKEYKVGRHGALDARNAELERGGDGSEAQQRKELRQAGYGP